MLIPRLRRGPNQAWDAERAALEVELGRLVRRHPALARHAAEAPLQTAWLARALPASQLAALPAPANAAALSLALARSAEADRHGPDDEQMLSATAEALHFANALAAKRISLHHALARQQPFSATVVNLNPKRMIRWLTIGSGAPLIAIRYQPAAKLLAILKARERFAAALAKDSANESGPAPIALAPIILASVDERRDEGWLVSAYAGLTLTDAACAGTVPTEPVRDRASGIFAFLERAGLAWSDFNPRNIALSTPDRWTALDLERLGRFDRAWPEAAIARFRLAWGGVLGRARTDRLIAARPATQSACEDTPLDPDAWDAEWLRQENAARETPLRFTIGLKRKLMALSFAIEARHDIAGEPADMHLVCCHLTDILGPAGGVAAHRLLCHACADSRGLFERTALAFIQAIDADRLRLAQGLEPVHTAQALAGRALAPQAVLDADAPQATRAMLSTLIS